MLSTFSVNIGNLLLSLSDAVEISCSSIAMHQIRTAYIAWRIAHGAGLQKSELSSRIAGGEFTIGSRILAVSDIFTALAEDRPYRKGMERNKIETILLNQVENRSLDKRITEILLDHFNEISCHVKGQQAISNESYRKYFRSFSDGQELFHAIH